MKAQVLKSLSRAKFACLAALATGGVVAGQLSADVIVKVRLVRSSGACGVVAAPALHVTCEPPSVVRPSQPSQPEAPTSVPGGPLLPDAGAVPYQRVGTIQAAGVASEPLPLYSDGTKITSWRVVTLDNARYVELTIAW